MTGPEHFKAAKALLNLAETEPEASQLTPEYLAAAQVHATLALTAATAASQATAYDGDEDGSRSRGWAGVA